MTGRGVKKDEIRRDERKKTIDRKKGRRGVIREGHGRKEIRTEESKGRRKEVRKVVKKEGHGEGRKEE